MSNSLEQRIQRLEDEAAIKRVIDTFSNLADIKDIDAQMELFAEDAVVETYFGDTLFASMTGPEEIGNVFKSFISNFAGMYHMNGQCTVDVDGDTATANHYCLVVLLSDVDGKKSKNFNGVVYKDEYVRQDGKWLIAKRVSRFTWRDISEVVEPS